MIVHCHAVLAHLVLSQCQLDTDLIEVSVKETALLFGPDPPEFAGVELVRCSRQVQLQLQLLLLQVEDFVNQALDAVLLRGVVLSLDAFVYADDVAVETLKHLPGCLFLHEHVLVVHLLFKLVKRHRPSIILVSVCLSNLCDFKLDVLPEFPEVLGDARELSLQLRVQALNGFLASLEVVTQLRI